MKEEAKMEEEAKNRKCRSGPKSKSSKFIGVSQYRRTGRWEAHIWDASGVAGKKGRQLHLGSFDEVNDAARAYDRAALHFRGKSGNTNFPVEQYRHDPVLHALRGLDKEAFVQRLRIVAQARRHENKRSLVKARGAPLRVGSAPAAERTPLKRNLPPKKQRPGWTPATAPVRKKTKASPDSPKKARAKGPRPKKLAPASPPRGNLAGSPSDSPTATVDLLPLSRAFHLGNGASVLNQDLFGSMDQHAHTTLAATMSGPPWRGIAGAYGEPAPGYSFEQEQHAQGYAQAQAQALAAAAAAAAAVTGGGGGAIYDPPGEGGSFLAPQLFDAGSPDRSDQTAPSIMRGCVEGAGDMSLLHQLEGDLADLGTRLQGEAEVGAFEDGGAPSIPPLQVTLAQVPAPGKGEDWGECLMPAEGPEWSEFDQSLAATVVEGVGEVSAELIRVAHASARQPGARQPGAGGDL
jgi:hypothetical protein